MALTRLKRRTRRLVVLLGLVLAAAIVDGREFLRVHDLNRAIASGAILGMEGDLPPEAVFAKAWYADRQGNYQLALSLYKQVETQNDGRLWAAAKYNSGNIYLREAMKLRNDGNEQQAIPFLELAKETYRQLLLQSSGNWDARYNLERALRLRPEGEEEAAGPAPLQAERAITTMKGFTLGLP